MAVDNEYLGAYKLCQKIHENNKNIVYRGKHRDTLEPVIIKLAKNASDRQQIGKYCHDYGIACQLNLPSIVVPLDLIKSQEIVALIMPDEGCVSLQEDLIVKQRLSLANFFPLALAISQVVEKLNKYQIYFLDLDLEHILISPDRQKIKLINFNRSLGKDASLGSTLFALGLVFYRLLTGKAEKAGQLWQNDCLIPKALQDIVNSLLKETNQAQYSSFAALIADLDLCWQADRQDNSLDRVDLLLTERSNNNFFKNNLKFLAENSNLIELVLNNSSEAIFWKDRNSVYLGCNQKFARLAGVANPQKIIGKTDRDLPWTQKEANWYRECDRRIMEYNLPEQNVIETQLSSTGKTTHVVTNKIPLRDVRGNTIGIFGSYRDVTPETILKQQSAAMEVALDGMAILKDGKYIYLNQAHAKIFGYCSPEALLGKSWHILYDPSAIAGLEAEIFPQLMKERFWQGELIAKRRDGSFFEEELSLILTEDNLLVCVCRDISDRKAIERQLKFTQFAVQNSADSFFYINPAGKIILANPSACKSLGYTQTELRALSFFDIDRTCAVSDREIWWAKHWQDLRQQKTLTFESIHYTKEGIGFPVEVVANYLQFEGKEYNFARAIDISERKKAEIAAIEELEKTRLFNQITQTIRQSLDTQTIFDTATREIRQLLKADRTCIFCIDNSNSTQGEFMAEDLLSDYSSMLGVKILQDFYERHYESHYREGKVLAIADTQNANLDSSYLAILERFQIRAILVIPLVLQQDAIWGFLWVHQCSTTRQWQTSEIEFVQKIATQLCLAIQQAQLLQAEKQQKKQIQEQKRIQTKVAQQQKVLTQIVRSIHLSLDLEQIYRASQTAIAQIKKLFNCDRITLYQFSTNSSTKVAINISELATIEPKAKFLMQNKSSPQIDGDNPFTKQYARYRLKIIQQFKRQGYLTVPVFVGENIWGFMAAVKQTPEAKWQLQEITFLNRVASQLGIAFQQAQLLQQLQRAKQNADAANQAKTKFLASMSHELRTPLNAILGFNQLMQRDPTLNNSQHLQTLQIINDSGEHLLNLINDVLEMSKIEAGKITLNTFDFDLHQFLNGIEKMLCQKAKSQQLQLQFVCQPDVPRYITGDERKLRQVAINLLSNSLKFTSQGIVSLKVSLSPKSDRVLSQPDETMIRFEVADTGVGIAENELNYLFDPFYQSEAGLKFQQGTGLGLSISKKFVELMGGTIVVKSQVGKGTTVTFDIRVKQAQTLVLSQSQTKQVIGIAANSQIPKILVVEDKWESRQLLIQLLEDIGCQVRGVENGLAGVNAWREWQPDLIWMDIQMPVMDGYRATSIIRQEEAKLKTRSPQNTIVIALTASAFQEDRDKILAVGCNEIIRKPFQASILLETLAKYLHLDFIYAEPQTSTVCSPAPKILSEPAIAQLLATTSSQWLKEFHSATVELDEATILQAISQLDESFAHLSHTLENWLHDFKFDSIVKCTEEAISIQTSSSSREN